MFLVAGFIGGHLDKRVNKVFFLVSLWIAKLVSFLISIFHLGQASNVPGKVALLINKDLLKDFKLKENLKIILITGTNGKSTTCGLLANILKTADEKVIYNKSGANLLSGIVSTFCHYSTLLGKINPNYIILEVDEATLPILTNQIKVDVIAVTNLFRDQLDRFGELDTTLKLIEKGINQTNATVVLNADDLRVAFLKTNNKKIYFALDCKEIHMQQNNSWLSDPEEITTCPKCNSSLVFSKKFLAHLGDYNCPKCNLKRPEISYLVTEIKRDNLTTNFDIGYENHKHNFFFPYIGIFNLYNALCAIAVAKTVSNVTPVQIQKAFQSYSTIFGRAEKVKINNKQAWIYLIKNPTGTTEVLKTLNDLPNARFLIAINDNFADGRDVSWLWDARFDFLASHKKEIFVSGKRALDMALRLKYADISPSQIKIFENIKTTVKNATESLKEDETLYILPTYTVLLEMQRNRLSKSVLL